MNVIEWLKKEGACCASIEWVTAQPDQSIPGLWAACPRGDWMLWVHEKSGTPAAALAPVAYRAANRAIGYAIAALDAAGVSHSLRELPEIVDKETAAGAADWVAAARAAGAAGAAGAAYWAAAGAAAGAAYWAAGAADWVARAAEAAEAAGAADWAAELLLSSNDCRELLPLPSINFDLNPVEPN